LEVRVPLHGQELFFGVVAAFAAGDHIAAGAFAAARNRNDVIHGQLSGGCRASAVMAFTFGHPALPPLGLPQIPGFAALVFQIRCFQIIGKGFDRFSFFHCSLITYITEKSTLNLINKF